MLQKWKSCLPFLAGFCLWQIVPLATFDLKNLAGKGQNISRNRSWVSSQVSCHSRARGCQVGPPGHSVKCSCLRSPGTCPGSVEAVEECVCADRERKLWTGPCLLHSSCSEETLVEQRELGGDPYGVGGKTLPGNPPSPLGWCHSFFLLRLQGWLPELSTLTKLSW